MNETRRTWRRWRSARAALGDRAASRGRRAGSPAALVLTGLALATGAPAVLGEAGERARQTEASPPLSVPFGSAAAAEIPQARGTAIRPILEGIMSPPDGTLVSVSGHPMRLAPGATIRDQYNRTILPGALRRPVPVRFTLDHLGHIQRVRIMPES